MVTKGMHKRPNLFILGAPKCGTTSLAAWLSDHPQVFISEPKEPEYFDHDRKKGFSDTLERYESFFSKAGSEHIAIGEASTGYLRSRVAVDEILNYAPDARFIVGLRNPVEMAISWHGQALFGGREEESDFEGAWRLQDCRRAGLRKVPRLCADTSDLMYADVCALGSQLKRLYEKVPRERVLVYTLDEMRHDPRELWCRVQSFLGVSDNGRKLFHALNEAKRVPKPLRILTRLVANAKRNLGIHHLGLGVLKRLNKKFAKKPAVTISDSFESELYSHFHTEVELLQRLTQRDLSAWMRSPETGRQNNQGNVTSGVDKDGASNHIVTERSIK